MTRHHSRAYENSVVAEGSLWAFGWSQEGRQLLSVKNILWNQDDVEKEVLFDIGEPIHVCFQYFHTLKTTLLHTYSGLIIVAI